MTNLTRHPVTIPLPELDNRINSHRHPSFPSDGLSVGFRVGQVLSGCTRLSKRVLGINLEWSHAFCVFLAD